MQSDIFGTAHTRIKSELIITLTCVNLSSVTVIQLHRAFVEQAHLKTCPAVNATAIFKSGLKSILREKSSH